jgi:hypothetical protein
VRALVIVKLREAELARLKRMAPCAYVSRQIGKDIVWEQKS